MPKSAPLKSGALDNCYSCYPHRLATSDRTLAAALRSRLRIFPVPNFGRSRLFDRDDRWGSGATFEFNNVSHL